MIGCHQHHKRRLCGLKYKVNTEKGVVPVIYTVPVLHKELLVTFLLVLIVARKREWRAQVELDVIYLFEKARCPEHRRSYIH